MTDVGTVAMDVFELVRETWAPDDPAAPPRVTVPVELLPPTTLVGLTETATMGAGVTVNVAVFATEKVAVIVTDVDPFTARDVTGKVIEVVFAGTVTLEGTLAAVDGEALNVTTAPTGPAFPVRVTVPTAFVPVETLVGETETVERAAGVTVTVADADVPRRAAVIVTGVEDATPNVAIWNWVEIVAPALTTTVAGTVATDVFELERASVVLPAGAAPDSFTVAFETPPLTTLVGEAETRVGSPGVTVSVPAAVTPPNEAEMMTFVGTLTARLVAVNVADVAPEVTPTLAGTVATAGLEDESVTVVPDAAAPSRVTVVFEVPPPSTGCVVKVTEAGTEEAVMPRVVVGVAPPYVAEIVTDVAVPPETLVAVNVPDLEPAAIVTGLVTVTLAGVPLVTVTDAPPAGAGPFSVTVPWTAPPRFTLA